MRFGDLFIALFRFSYGSPGVNWVTQIAVDYGENKRIKEMAEAVGADFCDGEQTQADCCT